MSSIADIPLDILRNCIIPHVYGDMLHDIHQELRVRAAIDDLGDRNRKYIVPWSGTEFEIGLNFDIDIGFANHQRNLLLTSFDTYMNGLDDSSLSVVPLESMELIDLFFRREAWVRDDRDRISYVSHFSLAVRRHVAFRLLKLMFPWLKLTYQLPRLGAYESFDRPFTLMLATPFYQSCALYVHRGEEEPFFARELIHRPGMVTLCDAFMDCFNRSRTLREGILYWCDIQTWKDGSIHLFTGRQDRCRY